MTRPDELISLSRLRERARVRARALRQGGTDAEALLWSKLRGRQLLGLKFRRQHPVSNYFADFACVEIGLVIELDGGQHNESAAIAYDLKRSDVVAASGFQTMRFWNNEVLTQTEVVLEKIWQMAETLTPTLSREREREQRQSISAGQRPLLRGTKASDPALRSPGENKTKTPKRKVP